MQAIVVTPEMEMDNRANKLILKAIGATSLAGFLDPTPGGLDVPVIVGAWMTMLGGMNSIYKGPFDSAAARIALEQGLVSLGSFVIGTKTLIFLLKLTGVGFLVGGGINAALNGIFTWRIGVMYQKRFKSGKAVSLSEVTTAVANLFLITPADLYDFGTWWAKNR
jgi:uncharacterized protein (DUF697 family)